MANEEAFIDDEYESEDTNDEIYSAHEGVDFRPAANAADQFSFADVEPAQNPLLNRQPATS